MDSSGILIDGFDRIAQSVHRVLDGLDPDAGMFRIDEQANSIAWLVWHLTRVQDDHVAHLAGTGQRWLDGGWAERFGLPLDPSDTGYGHDPEQVALVAAEARDLLDYFEDVHTATLAYLGTLTDDEFDRVIDTGWDPPVTVRVRLVSVVADDLQHVGQAAYLRGLVHRRPD